MSVCAHLEVPVHEALAVQEVDGLCDLQEDVQTLAVLPLLREATLRHPVLQVLLPTQLHLDIQVHLQHKGTKYSKYWGRYLYSTREFPFQTTFCFDV